MKVVLSARVPDETVTHENVIADTPSVIYHANQMGLDSRVIETIRRLNPDYVHFYCDTVRSGIERFDLDAELVYSCLKKASENPINNEENQED
jgi:hypothetical protein